MKIDPEEFRVEAEEKVRLDKRPTRVGLHRLELKRQPEHDSFGDVPRQTRQARDVAA